MKREKKKNNKTQQTSPIESIAKQRKTTAQLIVVRKREKDRERSEEKQNSISFGVQRGQIQNENKWKTKVTMSKTKYHTLCHNISVVRRSVLNATKPASLDLIDANSSIYYYAWNCVCCTFI